MNDKEREDLKNLLIRIDVTIKEKHNPSISVFAEEIKEELKTNPMYFEKLLERYYSRLGYLVSILGPFPIAQLKEQGEQ